MNMGLRYKGFISYNRRDVLIAEKLQRYLEQPELLGITEPLGAFFRDQTELAANDVLQDSIMGALDDSEWLIVVCSPQATDHSDRNWVERECSYFINGLNRGEHCLLLIAPTSPDEGNLFDWFPKAAMGHQERLAADARDRSDGWDKAIIKICAAILGEPLSKLYDRYLIFEARQHYQSSLQKASHLIALHQYEEAESQLLSLVMTNQLVDFRNMEWRYLLAQCNQDIGRYGVKGRVTSAAIYPEIQALFIGTAQGFLYRFHLLDSTLVFEGKAHKGTVETIQRKSDSEIITAGDDGYIKVWSSDSGLLVNSFHKQSDLFPHMAETFRAFITMHQPTPLAMNHNRTRIARVTGSTVTMWDLASGESVLFHIPQYKSGSIRNSLDHWHSIAFPNGMEETLVISSFDELISWNIASHDLLFCRHAEGNERFIGLSADGRLLVTKTGDTTIRMVEVVGNIEFPKVIHSDLQDMDFVACEKGSNSYRLLMSQRKSKLFIWTISGGEAAFGKPSVYPIEPTELLHIGMYEDFLLGIGNPSANQAALWKFTESPHVMLESVYDFELSTDRRYALAVVGLPETFILFALHSFEKIAAVRESYLSNVCVDVDEARQIFVTAGDGKEAIDVYHWDGTPMHRIPIRNLHDSPLLRLIRVFCTKVILHEHSRLIAGCSDGSIRIFDIHQTEPAQIISMHQSSIVCMVFEPASCSLLSVDKQNHMILWHAHEGALDFICRRMDEDGIKAVEFLPDRRIAAATSNGRIKLYNFNLQPVESREAGHSEVLSLQATLDGTRLMSVSGHGQIKLWCTNPFEEVHQVDPTIKTRKAAFSHAEETLIVLSDDHQLLAYDLMPAGVNTIRDIEAWKTTRRQLVVRSLKV